MLLFFVKLLSGLVFVLIPGFLLRENFKKYPILTVLSLCLGFYLLFISFIPGIENDNISSPTRTWKLMDHYQVNDNLVRDLTTNLVWLRCSVGQEWNGSSCIGKVETFKWEDSTSIANNFSYQGYSDWRLPSIDELKTLFKCPNSETVSWENKTLPYCDKEGKSPNIDAKIFPNRPMMRFCWSSSDILFGHKAWAIKLDGGSQGLFDKESDFFHVKLVRDY